MVKRNVKLTNFQWAVLITISGQPYFDMYEKYVPYTFSGNELRVALNLKRKGYLMPYSRNNKKQFKLTVKGKKILKREKNYDCW